MEVMRQGTLSAMSMYILTLSNQIYLVVDALPMATWHAQDTRPRLVFPRVYGAHPRPHLVRRARCHWRSIHDEHNQSIYRLRDTAKRSTFRLTDDFFKRI